MSSPRTALALAALLAAALLLFEVCARQLTGAWFTFGVHPEVLRQLELSLADQKRLAALDPGGVHDFIEKPFSRERLLRSIANTLEHAALRQKVRRSSRGCWTSPRSSGYRPPPGGCGRRSPGSPPPTAGC